MKEILKKCKGITLISLVITIVVLLILVGVVIQTLTGDNVLLQKATTAKESQEKATEEEKIKLAFQEYKISEYNNDSTTFKETLENSGIEVNEENIKRNTDDSYTLKYNGKTYQISKNGEITEGLLPKAYQQVEYIESTGTQYIDTGVIQSDCSDIHIELSGKFTTSKAGQFIFGVSYYETDNNSAFTLIGQAINNSGVIMQYGPAGTEKIISSFDTNRHIYILDTINKKGFFDYNTVVDLPGNINKIDYSYCLFAESFLDKWNGRNNYLIRNYSKFQMDYCSITDENKKYIRNFIPCYCTTAVTDVKGKKCSANTNGLYDTVEGKFYTNQGTGGFLKGEDVN